MKKTLIALVLTTASAWAAEGNVYHTIADPTWHVTRIGSRWVIEDSKGFFVGYYVPQAAPVAPAASSTPATPAAAPTAPPAPATQSNAGGSYSNNYGYSNYGYGYGNNGFYGNNYYNNGGYYYNNSANCPPRSHQPEPPLQPGRDKNDIPIGTPWQQVAR